MKDYIVFFQPTVTFLVAIGVGFIAIDQNKITNARFNCATVFGAPEGSEKDLAKLGLPKGGNYSNIRQYCRAFINPAESSSGGYASIDFPSHINVSITDMPILSGTVGIEGSVGIAGFVHTTN